MHTAIPQCSSDQLHASIVPIKTHFPKQDTWAVGQTIAAINLF
jgi:hypothetical protein